MPGPLLCTFWTTFPDIKPNIPLQSTFIQGPGLIRAESDCIAYVISLCSCINVLKALGAAVSRGRCSPRLLRTYLSGVWVHVSFLSALRLSQYWLLSATEKLVLYPDVSFKGIVHPYLLKMYSSSSHPTCRWVSSDFAKFSITSLAHQWILCSEWVPSE